MREFIEKVLTNQQININELSQFIVEYSELCGIKNTNAQHIQFAIQMIQQGMFSLQYAIDNYIEKSGLRVTERLLDKNGVLIKVKIEKNAYNQEV